MLNTSEVKPKEKLQNNGHESLNIDLGSVHDETVNRTLMNRLSSFLRGYGLTPFSSSIAIEYLKAQLAKPDGPAKFERVMLWLLQQLNGVKRQVFPCKTDGALEEFQDSEDLSNDSNSTLISPLESQTQLKPKKNWQMGCPNIIPGLRCQPIWDTEQFPWISELENRLEAIRSEWIGLRGKNAFQPYRAPPNNSNVTVNSVDSDHIAIDSIPSPASVDVNIKHTPHVVDAKGQLATDRGEWNVAYLYLHGIDFESNTALCPVTCETIRTVIPRHYSHAMFSALAPNTHITPHYGPTNKKLRCHLPLWVKPVPVTTTQVPSSGLSTDPSTAENDTRNAWLRVADHEMALEEGRALVFDDSCEHEGTLSVVQ